LLFQRNTRHGLNFGEAGPVIWLRVDVENSGARDGEWLFATRLTSIALLDVYLIRNNKSELLYSASDPHTSLASIKRHYAHAAAFVLSAGEKGTIFVRYLGRHISRMPLSISSFEAVAVARQDRYVVFSAIAASVAALVLYGSAIFWIIKGRIILYYAAAEIATVMIIGQANGILNVLFWPQSPLLQDLAPGLLNAFNVIFSSLFARNFFRLPERAPYTDLFFLVWIGVALVYIALTALILGQPAYFSIQQFIGYVLLTPLWLFLPLLAVFATLRWQTSYWPLIPGWSIITFGHLYWLAIVQGVVPEPPFHPQLIGFIAVGQAFFLAVAIVLEVRLLRDDRLRGQIELNTALQQQLAATQQKTEILRELAEQDRLVHAAGHDSRSILLGLRNFAAGLQQGTDATHVGIAAQAITHLTNDLEAVLSTTIASAAHGGATNMLALEMVPVAQMLAAVRLIHERSIRDRGLRFRVHGGAIELVTDRALLVRILGNLVDNACKYTEQGAIILAARCHGGILRIQVWDSGFGIAPEILTTLLDPRVGQVRVSEHGAGQGSGLQTAKSLAARIGGSISGCSRVGHGSFFELRLPLVNSFDVKQIAGAGRLWVLENTPDAALRLQRMAAELGLSVNYLPPAQQASLFAHGGVASTDFVLIAENFGGPGQEQEIAQRLADTVPRANIFITTYDRGVDVRARLAKSARIVLYEPVTTEALRMAIYAPKPSTSAME